MTLAAEKIIEIAWESLYQGQPLLYGCYPDMDNEMYHSIKSVISRSSLMDFDKSPYTYWAKHLNPKRPKKDATTQMAFGSMVHTYILEPFEFCKNYVIEPQKVLLKNVGRELYEQYKKVCEDIQLSGKIVVSQDEYDNLLGIKEKLYSSKEAMGLINDARIENSFFWEDEHSGLRLKARPDILHENMIVDLKTTSDASPRSFQHEMVKYGYHVQFAMIRDAIEAIEGRRINNFINIVIETKYPYNMAIYIIDEFAVNEGHVKYKQLCLDLKKATVENKWADYGVQTISLPKWAING
jgi:PDDEXK-like uncharacterized protein DUF3799